MTSELTTASGQPLTPELEAALVAEAEAGFDPGRLVPRRPRLSAEQIDARVAEWHQAPIGSPAAQVDLHEYLGMTWDQYQRWAATGEIPTV
jgi:hypothetical protein